MNIMSDGAARIISLILVPVLLVLLVISSMLLVSRFYYEKGILSMHDKVCENAIEYFKKAHGPITLADHHRIDTWLGRALYNQAIKEGKASNSSLNCFNILKKSEKYLKKAVKSDPHDYSAAFHLATTCGLLENLYDGLYKKSENPYNAAPMYENAILLRPCGITVHYSYVKYLHTVKKNCSFSKIKVDGDDRLMRLVEKTVQIYPGAYFYFKREPFFSRDFIPVVKKGLFTALENSTNADDAFNALSDLFLNSGDIDQALVYYKKMMAGSYSSPWSSYIHLGGLYLKSKNIPECFENFEAALDKRENRKSAIKRIYNLFCNEKMFNEFIRFSVLMSEKRYHITDLRIYIAKARIKMNQPELARAGLIKFNAEQRNAKAYYLLAKIAESKKKWGEMELAIQSAVVLDRENSHYLKLFTKALQKQKKYSHAEEIATKVLRYAKKNSPWYFNTRAWTRWPQEKYHKAIMDWKRALDICDDQHKSDFMYRISWAYYSRGFSHEAAKYIRKAIELEPLNKKYKKWEKIVEE